jgi:enoyl-CoA hydratase/carnithine racemase
MADALEQVDADPTLRVALLTGTGDTFTSGNDITDFQSRAAVNGAAFDVGTTMQMHCDLIVAARSECFVMPSTSLGLRPETARLLLFPHPLGNQRASALLLLPS